MSQNTNNNHYAAAPNDIPVGGNVAAPNDIPVGGNVAAPNDIPVGGNVAAPNDIPVGRQLDSESTLSTGPQVADKNDIVIGVKKPKARPLIVPTTPQERQYKQAQRLQGSPTLTPGQSMETPAGRSPIPQPGEQITELVPAQRLPGDGMVGRWEEPNSLRMHREKKEREAEKQKQQERQNRQLAEFQNYLKTGDVTPEMVQRSQQSMQATPSEPGTPYLLPEGDVQTSQGTTGFQPEGGVQTSQGTTGFQPEGGVQTSQGTTGFQPEGGVQTSQGTTTGSRFPSDQKVLQTLLSDDQFIERFYTDSVYGRSIQRQLKQLEEHRPPEDMVQETIQRNANLNDRLKSRPWTWTQEKEAYYQRLKGQENYRPQSLEEIESSIRRFRRERSQQEYLEFAGEFYDKLNKSRRENGLPTVPNPRTRHLALLATALDYGVTPEELDRIKGRSSDYAEDYVRERINEYIESPERQKEHIKRVTKRLKDAGWSDAGLVANQALFALAAGSQEAGQIIPQTLAGLGQMSEAARRRLVETLAMVGTEAGWGSDKQLQDLFDSMTGGKADVSPENSVLLRQLGYKNQEELRRDLVEGFGEDLTSLQEGKFTTTLGRGLGSSMGFLGGGVATRAVIDGRMARLIGLSAMGAGVNANASYQEALSLGATEDQALSIALINGLAGTAEALPIDRILESMPRIIRATRAIDKASGGRVKRAILSGNSRTVMNAVEEAFQEGGQTLVNNASIRAILNNDRELLDGLGESTLVGGLVGGMVGGAANTAATIQGLSEARRQDQLDRSFEQGLKERQNAIESETVETDQATEDAQDAVEGDQGDVTQQASETAELATEATTEPQGVDSGTSQEVQPDSGGQSDIADIRNKAASKFSDDTGQLVIAVPPSNKRERRLSSAVNALGGELVFVQGVDELGASSGRLTVADGAFLKDVDGKRVIVVDQRSPSPIQAIVDHEAIGHLTNNLSPEDFGGIEAALRDIDPDGLDAAINNYLARYRQTTGRTITDSNTLREEAVANYVQRLSARQAEGFVERLAQNDAGLATRVLQTLANLVRRLKQAFGRGHSKAELKAIEELDQRVRSLALKYGRGQVTFETDTAEQTTETQQEQSNEEVVQEQGQQDGQSQEAGQETSEPEEAEGDGQEVLESEATPEPDITQQAEDFTETEAGPNYPDLQDQANVTPTDTANEGADAETGPAEATGQEAEGDSNAAVADATTEAVDQGTAIEQQDGLPTDDELSETIERNLGGKQPEDTLTVGKPSKQLSAKRLNQIKDMIRKNGVNPAQIAGKRHATLRQSILALINGKKPPKTKSGMTEVRNRLLDIAGISGGSMAAQDNALNEWIKVTETPKPRKKKTKPEKMSAPTVDEGLSLNHLRNYFASGDGADSPVTAKQQAMMMAESSDKATGSDGFGIDSDRIDGMSESDKKKVRDYVAVGEDYSALEELPNMDRLIDEVIEEALDPNAAYYRIAGNPASGNSQVLAYTLYNATGMRNAGTLFNSHKYVDESELPVGSRFTLLGREYTVKRDGGAKYFDGVQPDAKIYIDGSVVPVKNGSIVKPSIGVRTDAGKATKTEIQASEQYGFLADAFGEQTAADIDEAKRDDTPDSLPDTPDDGIPFSVPSIQDDSFTPQQREAMLQLAKVWVKHIRETGDSSYVSAVQETIKGVPAVATNTKMQRAMEMVWDDLASRFSGISPRESHETTEKIVATFGGSINNEDTNETSTRSGMARNLPDSGASDSAGPGAVPTQTTRTGRSSGRSAGTSGGGRLSTERDSGVPTGDAASTGSRGDQPGDSGSTGTTGSTAGRGNEVRDNPTRGDGVRAESSRSRDARLNDPASEGRKGQDGDTSTAGDSRNLDRPRTQATSDVEIVDADAGNIAQTLPQLKPEQQNDIVIGETRLFNNDANGVLFTNGTGTGKTFTGLGMIARHIARGFENILVVTPKSVVNSWTNTAQKFFGLSPVTPDNTQSMPSGFVIVNYENARKNQGVFKVDWDLVVYDESHHIMGSQNADETASLVMHRGVTNHRYGTYRKAMRTSPKMIAYQKNVARLVEQYIAKNGLSERDAKRKAHNALEKQYLAAMEQVNELNKQYQAKWGDTKVVFLSATPFKYVKNLDYAEGFLFDFGPEPESGSYNAPDARSQFYISNFGYRMRYNKLTQPEGDVDSSLLEREFQKQLMESGALSGRRLDVPFDYSRDFVQIENPNVAKISNAVIEILDHNNGYEQLSTALRDELDWHARNRLLEALKVREAVDRVRKHLELGRKVVVFHNYRSGAAVNPLVFRKYESPSNKNERKFNDEVDRFYSKFPGIEKIDFRGAMTVPQMREAFGDNMAEINGSISKEDRTRNMNQFNDDNSGVDVIVVQTQAGREGISLHDTTGVKQRALVSLNLPMTPSDIAQMEGRIYRIGQQSNAIIEYLTTNEPLERMHMASKAAKRAGTVENLALGHEARAMERAIKDGYESSRIMAPNEDQGTGTKESDRSSMSEVEGFDTAIAQYYTNQKQSRRKVGPGASASDYFATPEPLGFKMIADWADLKPRERVLEPSAGHGAIARYAPDHVTLTVVEPDPELFSQVGMKANAHRTVNDRFESLHKANKYEAIVMNPPFGTGGKTAMEHVAKAAEQHLKEYGRLVAIVPDGPAMQKRFDAWYESDDASGLHLVADIKLPAVTFSRAGTGVLARVVVLDKVDSDSGVTPPQQINRDLRQYDSPRDFFEAIRDMAIPDRALPQEYSVNAIMETEDSGGDAGGETQQQIAPAKTGASVVKQYHGKRQMDYWVVVPGKSMDRSQFDSMMVAVKDRGGWYNRKYGSSPAGFAFDSEATANKFRDDMFKGDDSESSTPFSIAPPVDSAEFKRAASMSFEEYRSAVSSEGDADPDHAAEAVSMSGARGWGDEPIVAQIDTREGRVQIRQVDDFNFLATAGEENIVGAVYAEPQGGQINQVSLVVSDDWTGMGIGTELMWQFRSRHPFALSGGLSDSGNAVLKKVHKRFQNVISNPDIRYSVPGQIGLFTGEDRSPVTGGQMGLGGEYVEQQAQPIPQEALDAGLTEQDYTRARVFSDGEPTPAYVSGVKDYNDGRKAARKTPVVKTKSQYESARRGFKDAEAGANTITRQDRNMERTEPGDTGSLFSIAGWHGSPHDFDRFSLDYMGTGEGAQAYGWGLYFAGKREVAEHYREFLSRVEVGGNNLSLSNLRRGTKEHLEYTKGDILRAIGRAESLVDYWTDDQPSVSRRREAQLDLDELRELERSNVPIKLKSRLYQVELAPDEDEYLLWDKPLSEQSERVQEIIRDNAELQQVLYAWDDQYRRRGGNYSSGMMGAQFYMHLGDSLVGQDGARRDQLASKRLRSLGIRGIKYLDGSSRGQGDGSYNYVIFDDADVSITSKFSIPGWDDSSKPLTGRQREIQELRDRMVKHIANDNPNYLMRGWQGMLDYIADKTVGKMPQDVKSFIAGVGATRPEYRELRRQREGGIAFNEQELKKWAKTDLFDNATEEEMIVAYQAMTGQRPSEDVKDEGQREYTIFMRAWQDITTMAQIKEHRLAGNDELADIMQSNLGKYMHDPAPPSLRKKSRRKRSGLGGKRRIDPGPYHFKLDEWTIRIVDGKSVKHYKLESSPLGVTTQEEANQVMRALSAIRQGDQQALLDLPYSKDDMPDILLKAARAGKRLKLLKPLTESDRIRLGYDRDPRSTATRSLYKTFVNTHNLRFFRQVAEKYGRKPGSTITDKEAWAKQEGLKQIPTSKRYGALSGLYVPADIHADVTEIFQQQGLIMKAWENYLHAWKSSVTIYNPSTHARNIMGNALVFAMLDSPIGVAMNMPKAIQEVVNRGPAYRELLQEGIIGGEYVGNEIRKIVDRDFSKLDGTWDTAIEFLRRIHKVTGEIYNAEDQIFKVASYLNQRSKGKSQKEAARHVDLWYPNYRESGQLTKFLSKHGLGGPFIMFMDQSIRIAGRAAYHRPARLAAIAAMPGIMTLLTRLFTGDDEDEQYLQDVNRSYFEPLMPWRDKDGRRATLDLRYIIPLGNDVPMLDYGLAGIERAVGSREQMPALQQTQLGFFGQQPLVGGGMEIMFNRNLFTGREIVNYDDSASTALAKRGYHLAADALPIPTFIAYGPKRLANSGVFPGITPTQLVENADDIGVRENKRKTHFVVYSATGEDLEWIKSLGAKKYGVDERGRQGWLLPNTRKGERTNATLDMVENRLRGGLDKDMSGLRWIYAHLFGSTLEGTESPGSAIAGTFAGVNVRGPYVSRWDALERLNELAMQDEGVRKILKNYLETDISRISRKQLAENLELNERVTRLLGYFNEAYIRNATRKITVKEIANRLGKGESQEELRRQLAD